MQCPACRTKLDLDHRFCPRCGAAVAAPAAVAGDRLEAVLAKALEGRYRILRVLGSGGMGAVYLARELALDRLVAIKILPPDKAGGTEARERFRREARTAARLTHPNIVPLHSFGEAEGITYLVMGYVRGEPLAARMRREGKIPPDEARRILAEIADALDYAHRQGVVHRDVKPDNVLIDDDSGRPMLADFGVARSEGHGTLTEAGGVVGTPEYMSPEQASGRGVDGRSDLYSLGVVAYTMLAGRPPFEGETPRDVLLRHLTEDAVPLRALDPELPADLAEAVSRCLAKDKEARWPDGRSLRDALGARPPGEGPLPDELQPLESQGFWLAAKVLAGLYALAFAFAGGPAEVGIIGYLTGFVVPLYLVASGWSLLSTARGVARRFTWRKILEVALWPPRWWNLWYPARLRRPEDVWPRLPAVARRCRALWTAADACLCLVVAPRFVWANLPGHLAPVELLRLLDSVVLGFVALLGVLVFSTSLAWSLRLARCGVGPRERDGVLFLFPTAQPAYWKKPTLTALLRPATDRPREPQAPHDYVRAIAGVAQDLTTPLRPVGDEALAAARQLASVLDSLDREIARLARDAEPAELVRLEERLAALGAESEEERQMRELLARQRDLLRGLRARLDEARDRRGRLGDLLRTLWLEVASLRASTQTATAAGISGRVQALCSEIEDLTRVFAPSPAQPTTLTR